MLKNYFKIALRNLSKQKLYSVINITGLSLALVVSIFSILFVTQELSFDKFHEDEDRIFRLVTVFGEGMRQDGSLSESPAVLKPTIADQVPEIEAMARIKAFEVPVKKENNSFKERIFFVEKEFFDIFSFELKRGNKSTLLDSPNEVVISESIAQKYFPDEDPIGQILNVYLSAEFHDFTVSGVIEDALENSSIQHDFLFSYNWLINFNPGQYDINEWAPNVFNFVKLDKSFGSIKEANAKLFPVIDQVRGAFLEERGFNRNSVTYELQPVSNIHLSSDVRNWPNTVLLGSAPSNILYSYILISIAIIVLIIACINYTTYSIGYSMYRGKEVGVRKTLGAGKRHIMLQFWLETLILTLISMVVGLALLQLLLPVLNSVLGLSLSLNLLMNPLQIGLLAGLWILVSIIAGSYPSLVLSGFKPQRVLKGQTKSDSGKVLSRVLVGVQYAGVLILIICLITILKQLNHIQSKSFGDEDQQVLIIRNQRSADMSHFVSYERIKSELESSGYQQITASFGAVNDDLFMIGYNRPGENNQMYARAFITDYNYFDIYNDIELKHGRFFDKEYATDTNNAIVVNEAFVKEMSLENPVGAELGTNAGRIQSDQVQIIGVVKDFHFESLHESIAPAVFLPIRESVPTRYISVKFPASKTGDLIDKASTVWNNIHPGLPIEYSFLDQRYKSFYTSEIRWKNITTYATIFGILISVMGIVALTGLSANNRRKEIGIRKILGASNSSILILLGKQFLFSLIFSFLLAAPVSHYLMSNWLQNFSYAINIGLFPFMLAGVVTLLVTILSFGLQALKAASGNPVQSLRSE